MKGKVKFSLKLMLTLVVLFTAGVCLSFGVKPKGNGVYAAPASTITTVDGKTFSALYGDDIIMSVEKVRVKSNDTSSSFTGDNTFYNYDDSYSFSDIANGDDSKTVVDNGQFIKLDNVKSGDNYVSETNTNTQEAVMVSIGQYVVKKDSVKTEVKIADNTITAELTTLNITLNRGDINGDGKLDYVDLPGVRNVSISGALYLDFAYLITQDSASEGYYEFTFTYSKNNQQVYEETFCFYLIFNSSYTEKVNIDGVTYTAEPTLGWDENNSVEFSKTPASGEEYVNYYIGQNGFNTDKTVSYPTLTYDYTKFKMSYTHTANRKVTTYTYNTTVTQNLGMGEANLSCEIANNEGTRYETLKLSRYKNNNTTNLLTVMLTEPGTYLFHFEYIYDGYNAHNAPNIDMAIPDKKLNIQGFNLDYSKAGFESAQMKYYELATSAHASDCVDLFVPNGYERSRDMSAFKDEKIGFMYTTIPSTKREGTVILDDGVADDQDSEDSLINAQLRGLGYDDDELKNLTKDNIVTSISTLDISGINVPKTNQGSLSLSGNSEFADTSFYIFSAKSDFSDGVGNRYTNQTSFNSTGYYVVFIDVIVGKEASGANKTYRQVFAFEFTAKTIDVSVVDTKGNHVGGDGYTNTSVTVTWEEPKIFEKEVKGYYYASTNKKYATREELLTLSENTLSNGGPIGVNVQDGQYVQYLIRLQGEGESATYKMFTIDKQDISNVVPYVIAEKSSNGENHYAFAQDKYGDYVPITNAITDSYVTMLWDNKASGALITAKYSYAPIEVNSDKPTYVNNEAWITTNYGLGEVQTGYEIRKADSRALVEDDCILFDQGIYFITLTDQAGNTCNYALVIDRTEAYFNIESEFVTGKFQMFNDTIHYDIAKYKAFKLGVTPDDNTTADDEISKVINLNFDDKYYEGNHNNKNALAKLFQKNGNDIYLTVVNKGIVAYDDDSIDNAIASNKGTLNYEKSANTSYVRTLYIIGENHTYSSMVIEPHDSSSFMEIEINTDNARGMAFYSDTLNISMADTDENGGDTAKAKRLYTGSDDGEISGITEAKATSSTKVVFVWNIGSGNYEVKEVKYDYYTLDTTSYNKNTYFYTLSRKDVPLFANSLFQNGAVQVGNRGFVSFGGSDVNTQPGLYVVTRSYVDKGAHLDHDELTKKYYFIVDRNGIISTSIGQNIQIGLLEQETSFNDFTQANAPTATFGYAPDKIVDQEYGIYLTTNKLPATLSIPAGKYFSAENESSAGYEAGRLSFAVYFDDIHKQVTGDTEKIFEGDIGELTKGYFTVNIYNYLNQHNTTLLDKLVIDQNNAHWIYLPGRYIVAISDNVLDTDKNTNKIYLGFEITKDEVGPEIEITNGNRGDNLQAVDSYKVGTTGEENYQYNVSVSQEYLKLDIPAYKTDVTEYAQVDPDYLVIEQHYNNGSKSYIDTTKDGALYTLNGAGTLSNGQKVVVNNTNGGYSVYLDTILRDEVGNIDEDSLTKPLYYVVKVRYKVDDATLRAYHYYDESGNLVDFYETTYTITIDREAPIVNVKNLHDSDSLVSYYNAQFGTDTMYENSYHETYSRVFFTNQYAKYYEATKDIGKIFAYRATKDTPYSTEDIKEIYVSKAISDISKYILSLPYRSGYTSVTVADNMTFDTLFDGAGYYEVIEIDSAGNQTQYIVYYSDSETSFSGTITANMTTGKSGNISIGTTMNKETYNIFGVKEDGVNVDTLTNDCFIRIELSNASTGEKTGINTFANTDTKVLQKDIEKLLNDATPGNYAFTIYYRGVETKEDKVNIIAKYPSISINKYDANKIKDLDINQLIEKKTVDDKETYYINLNGANRYNEEDKIWYYATKIVVKYKNKDGDDVEETYNGNINDDGNIEYCLGDDTTPLGKTELLCLENTTYQISMTDITGDTKSMRFNTAGKEFYSIEFAGNGESMHSNYDYYAYTSATLSVDETLFTYSIEYRKNGENWVTWNNDVEYITINDEGNIVFCGGDFLSGNQGVYQFKVIIKYGEETEQIYNITIDNTIGEVNLRDTKGTKKDMVEYYNAEYYDTTVQTDSTSSGIMNLSWVKEDSEYFVYKYYLYDEIKEEYREDFTNLENGYRKINLNNVSSYVINTATESSGRYRLVVEVWTNEEESKYVGNRVYAFEVQAVNNQIYYVRNVETGLAVFSNTSYKVSELTSQMQTNIENLWGDIKSSIPLYISSDELQVVLSDSENVTNSGEEIIEDNDDYTFSMYKISKGETFTVYLGILRVKETDELVSNLRVVKTEDSTAQNNYLKDDTTSYSIIGSDSSVTISLDGTYLNTGDVLLNKNQLILEVSYNGTLLEECVMTDVNPDDEIFTFSYTIIGNGDYTFRFLDKAGNVHKFSNGLDTLQLLVLREVAVVAVVDKVDEKTGEPYAYEHAPIDNAYYNSAVTIKVYASTKYVTSSISVTATRNGEHYTVKQTTNPYIFSEFGTYKVTITGQFWDGTQTYDLVKELRFTILNVKEARPSIDLTALSGYDIVKVKNPTNLDVTEDFLSMIKTSDIGGLLVTYEKIMENANNLKVSAGKLTFTITYVVKDDFYPSRAIDLAFTLNSESPKIDCSLAKGESTNKSFTISFNPAILYEQIGECYVYVNGMEVAHITEENRPNILQTKTISFKENGAGDYYIKLQSGSGNIWDHYKVTITEPLNVWAIVIIVVVVVVVVTVTVVIIVLRNKMRIR
ncbi:MAG: hypothetical protein E7351_01170 [Clostridiales bacterium]|nr:hypothetical protein [Clostridiales bacterium]